MIKSREGDESSQVGFIIYLLCSFFTSHRALSVSITSKQSLFVYFKVIINQLVIGSECHIILPHQICKSISYWIYNGTKRNDLCLNVKGNNMLFVGEILLNLYRNNETLI